MYGAASICCTIQTPGPTAATPLPLLFMYGGLSTLCLSIPSPSHAIHSLPPRSHRRTPVRSHRNGRNVALRATPDPGFLFATFML